MPESETVLDYRGDWAALPTAAMRKAMAEAELGNDMDGEDPTVNRLEERVAEMLGKEAALYMYPYEDHGPLTKETILDQWARWTAWLDTYVKNPTPP